MAFRVTGFNGEPGKRPQESGYTISPPGGPAGHFWGIIRNNGNVIAMQITSEADARLFIAALDARDRKGGQ